MSMSVNEVPKIFHTTDQNSPPEHAKDANQSECIHRRFFIGFSVASMHRPWQDNKISSRFLPKGVLALTLEEGCNKGAQNMRHSRPSVPATAYLNLGEKSNKVATIPLRLRNKGMRTNGAFDSYEEPLEEVNGSRRLEIQGARSLPEVAI